MKNKLLLVSLIFTIVAASCKKDNNDDTNSNVSQQIGQLVAKYSNLKTFSVSKTKKQQLSASDLKIIDDSLAFFSAEVKRIHVILDTVNKTPMAPIETYKSIKSASIRLQTNDVINGSGSQTWSGFQTAGSSTLGYYRVNYFAVFTYNTVSSSYNYFINNIISVSGIVSSAQPASFSYGGPLKYDIYDWSYNSEGSNYGIQSGNQICNLSYNGQVTCQHSATIAGITYKVAGTSEALSYNQQVASSIFPFIEPQ